MSKRFRSLADFPDRVVNTLMKSVFESSPDAILIVDGQARILLVNKQTEAMFGYRREEMLGKPIELLIPERFATKHVEHRNGYIADPRVRTMGTGYELYAKRKDGSEFSVDILLGPLATEIDRLTIAIVRDTTESKAATEKIKSQQQDILELSTPVIDLWPGIVALPIVGTLDSSRSKIVNDRLLQCLTTSRCSVVILDISGVPTVDTLVAENLVKTVAAARLMGAECIISGVRPEIALTMVHLGIDLSSVKTKSTMSRALEEAMAMLRQQVEAENL